MANLGADLWGHSEEARLRRSALGTSSMRRCSNRSRCAQRAVIQIDCRDQIGHPFRNRDHCEAHTRSVLKRGRGPSHPSLLVLRDSRSARMHYAQPRTFAKPRS